MREGVKEDTLRAVNPIIGTCIKSTQRKKLIAKDVNR